ncbi:RNA polymerase sigma factor [Oerskovia paurometabola]|uniref:RNA polymerase sigma factor n=1 Tax=Oerskovia paurometabola TaxID=162170 RepID=A0ABW1XA76_9CELL|nr:sigma-70 family RNA polymerase sigma factor [Oerskovia paurometabola]MBM7496182.1 RNA polymerase sigma factor (sigma-70 family) [Oerskovia paurometabola]
MTPAPGSGSPPGLSIEDLLRTEAPQVLGALVRRFSRFDVAEDAVQEALLVASTRWPVEGVPSEPRSWLVRVAYRRMIDLLRTEQARHRRERTVGEAVLAEHASGREVIDDDDSLALLLLCAHPSLSPTSQVALTLRAVGGLTTAEIAHAYGVSEATMGTRVSRAKQQLRQEGTRFVPTTSTDRDVRLASVLRVLYLVFNEGYTATSGTRLGRVDLAREAVRLARLARAHSPRDPEVAGLLALMLLTEARRDARTDDQDHLVRLEDQDRSRWDHEMIEEGRATLDAVWPLRSVGPYQVQAAIAAVHASATGDADTDWPQIAALYLWLERLAPTGPVRLARVVAVARAFGPRRGLDLLDALDREHGLATDPLAGPREPAVRAHLLDDLGRRAEAADAFRSAAARTQNAVEQDYLLERARASAARDPGTR